MPRADTRRGAGCKMAGIAGAQPALRCSIGWGNWRRGGEVSKRFLNAKNETRLLLRSNRSE